MVHSIYTVQPQRFAETALGSFQQTDDSYN
jgi:hypothetical protein